MRSREKDILDGVDAYLAMHDRWSRVEDGINHITAEYSDSLDVMFGIWRAGGIPETLSRKFIQAMDTLASELGKYDEQDHPEVRETFWRAVESLKNARTAPQDDGWKSQRPCETIKQLNDQGVGHEQIAKMWGLVEDWPNGRVRVDQVQKELDNPGSVINDEYEHPGDAQAKAEYEARQAMVTSRLEEYAQAEAEKQEATCPESSYELWSSGNYEGGTRISVEQAALMLGQDVDEVRAEWAQFDVDATKQVDHAPPEEEAEGPEVSEELAALRSQARELGIGFNHRTTADTLRDKIAQKAEAGV